MDKLMLKKIRIVDAAIVLAILLVLVVGFLTFKNIRSTASKQVVSTSQIAFQVFLRGVTMTGKTNPIKVGDKTFISIRNVPYTDLKIVDVKADTKKVVMPSPRTRQPFVLVDDYSQAFMYDVIVTVVDTAKITKDGAVVGGNKIKIGLPITLEGKDYKFNGTVSDVVVLPPNSKINIGGKPVEANDVNSSAQKQPQQGSQLSQPMPPQGQGQQVPPVQAK